MGFSPSPDPFSQRMVELHPKLLARARALLGGRHFGTGAPDADDLAQTTIVQLLDRAPPSVRTGSAEDGARFAFRSLHHAFIDQCVRKRRERLAEAPTDDTAHGAEDEDLACSQPNPEAAVSIRHEAKNRRQQLQRALSSLDAQERDFLAETLTLGSAPAAQRTLGWPPGSAANACKRRATLVRKVRLAIHQKGAVDEPTS